MNFVHVRPGMLTSRQWLHFLPGVQADISTALQVRMRRPRDAASSRAEPSITSRPFEIKEAAAQCLEAPARSRHL